MSLVKNEDQLIPFHYQAGRPFVLITVGESLPALHASLQNYAALSLIEIEELRDIRFSRIPDQAVIIVGIAVAVGITQFGESAVAANRDAVAADCQLIVAKAQRARGRGAPSLADLFEVHSSASGG